MGRNEGEECRAAMRDVGGRIGFSCHFASVTQRGGMDGTGTSGWQPRSEPSVKIQRGGTLVRLAVYCQGGVLAAGYLAHVSQFRGTNRLDRQCTVHLAPVNRSLSRLSISLRLPLPLATLDVSNSAPTFFWHVLAQLQNKSQMQTNLSPEPCQQISSIPVRRHRHLCLE
jgi:hypothetical protein